MFILNNSPFTLMQHSTRQHFFYEAVAGAEHRSFHKLHTMVGLFDVQFEHRERNVVLECHAEHLRAFVHQIQQVHAAMKGEFVNY